MYLKLTNGIIEKYPYSIGDLRRDNSQTSFPATPSKELLAEWGVLPVKPVDQPQYDLLTQTLTETTPQQVDGEWVQVWGVSEATPEQIAERKAEKNNEATQNRMLSYRNEADPLFFKWQRGEATEQEWLDKVSEIKLRFPKID